MLDMAAIVLERESKAKVIMKKHYDKTAKEVTFKEGDSVLVHKPGLHGKMDDVWEGPYHLGKKVSSVNFGTDAREDMPQGPPCQLAKTLSRSSFCST